MRKKYQQGGVTVLGPARFDAPEFGDITNTTPVQAPALTFPDMAQMMDPSRLLAQREAALARQLAQKEKSLQAASKQMTEGYDDVFGPYHNESQRKRLEAVRERYGIKNPGEIDLNNETEIRRNYQNILRAKDDDTLRGVMGEVEAANRFMKLAPTGLEGPEAEEYLKAYESYWGHSDPTSSAPFILKLNPAQYREAAAVRKTNEAGTKIFQNVKTWGAAYRDFFAASLKDLDTPGTQAYDLMYNTGLNMLTADNYNVDWAKARGYVTETEHEGGIKVYDLTPEGYKYVKSTALMAGIGQEYKYDRGDAARAARTTEKSTEMDEKLAFVQSWVDPAGGSPSFWQDPASKDVRDALLSYPNFESLPACAQSAIRTVVTGVSVKDNSAQYRILDTLRNCLGTAKADGAGRVDDIQKKATAKDALGVQ